MRRCHSSIRKERIQQYLSVSGVEYYTAGGYTTADIDMILPPLEKEEIETVMKELGFERFEDYRHWLHPDIPVPLSFSGPLRGESLLIHEWVRIESREDHNWKSSRWKKLSIRSADNAQEWKTFKPKSKQRCLMYVHYTEIDWAMCTKSLHSCHSQTIGRFREQSRRVKESKPCSIFLTSAPPCAWHYYWSILIDPYRKSHFLQKWI